MPLFHIVRRVVLMCCLFPASFACYPSARKWLHAARNGKRFFLDIMEQADDLIKTLSGRSLLWRALAGYPLRFARQIVWKESVGKALRHCLFHKHEKSISVETPCIDLKKPSSIELIPGLLKGKKGAHRQATLYLRTLLSEPTSIPSNQCHVIFGAEHDFSDKTTVVLAHWDPDEIVDPYVQHMCRQFKSLGWDVVLASAAPLRDFWETKPDWIDAAVYRTCPGYDFTSWKTALSRLPSLYDCRELILCNDSVFGGIGSYAPMHEQMAHVPCDFWGITESREKCPHLQSFHLVFRRNALAHPAFKAFFDRVPLSDSRKTAIVCETSLALWLAKHGLRPAAFAPFNDELDPSVNPSCEEWQLLLHAGVPLLKRELLQKNERKIPLAGWGKILSAKGYPLQLIFAYFERRKVDLTDTYCYGKQENLWPPNVCALQYAIELGEGKPTVFGQNNDDLGVFFHIFYTDLANEMLACVDNLPPKAFVHISTDTEAKREELLAIFARRGYGSRSEIRVFPNKGWDIAPFLVGYRDAISRYSLILRMHSKRSLHIPGDTGEQWRKMLYAALAGSRERVGAILEQFAQEPSLGMVCPPLLPHYAHCVHFGGNFSRMRTLLLQRGILITPDMPIDFPMGSMFWCRPQALLPWLKPGFTFDDFTPSANLDIERDGTLAHALERLFFFGCGLAGMSWARIPSVVRPLISRQ